MKIEIGSDFPKYFKPSYPEEFELFHHFEVTAGIPTVLFAVTTWKENGKPNVCFHSWNCFHGDKTAFFAVMGNLYQHTHSYKNIQREKCFGINFLPISSYDSRGFCQYGMYTEGHSGFKRLRNYRYDYRTGDACFGGKGVRAGI